MKPDRRLPYDIAIVGLGMVGIHQITREAEEVIRRCRHVFITDMALGVADHLRKLAPKVTDLTTRRELGSHRVLIYRRMASEVVAAALEEPTVAFATYGHPNLYCYPTTLIQRAAQVLDLKTRVIPGISSLDTILADLGLDPGFDGLQIYEASDVLIRNRPVHADAGLIIVQAPIVLDAANRPGERSAENLRLLQNYLLKFYPPSHVVMVVTSRTHPLLPSITQRTPLERLADTLQHGSNVATLYLPPVKHRDIAEPGLADRMQIGKESEGTGRRPGRPSIGPKPS
jgi:uncharacterized protein YabN with tetrapyrrole methylase and pyrophosphatase domain